MEICSLNKQFMLKLFLIDTELLIGGDYSGFIYCVLEFVIFWFLNV